MTKPIIEHKIKCGRMVMLFWIVLSYAACELFVETSKPVTMNMVKGKVLNWKDNEFYIIDIGTVYKPESETVIFVAAIGSAYENRKEWVVEADLNNFEFIRGTGKEPFTIWPEDIRRKAIKLAISAPSPQGTLEHPLAGLNKQQRTDFIYSTLFDNDQAAKLVLAVNYWAKKRYEECKQLFEK